MFQLEMIPNTEQLDVNSNSRRQHITYVNVCRQLKMRSHQLRWNCNWNRELLMAFCIYNCNEKFVICFNRIEMALALQYRFSRFNN